MTGEDSKPTNPKDIVASDRLPLHLVPSTINAYASLAFLEGALKYGAYNWRMAGIRMSVYIAALERHLDKFKNGEWADPKTRVPHLSSVIACAGIILDAMLADKATDDRAPVVPLGELHDQLQETTRHLKGLFGDRSPYHYTIADAQPGASRLSEAP